MSATGISFDARVANVREAFDRAFAAAPPGAPTETDNLLAVRVVGEPYGIRVRDLARLAPAGTIVPVPSRRGALLGLAGSRGGVVPVYGLAELLGSARRGAVPKWLAVVGERDPVALAFEELDGFLEVRRTDITTHDGREVVHTDGGARRLLDVRSLATGLNQTAGAPGPMKEA